MRKFAVSTSAHMARAPVRGGCQCVDPEGAEQLLALSLQLRRRAEGQRGQNFFLRLGRRNPAGFVRRLGNEVQLAKSPQFPVRRGRMAIKAVGLFVESIGRLVVLRDIFAASASRTSPPEEAGTLLLSAKGSCSSGICGRAGVVRQATWRLQEDGGVAWAAREAVVGAGASGRTFISI